MSCTARERRVGRNGLATVTWPPYRVVRSSSPAMAGGTSVIPSVVAYEVTRAPQGFLATGSVS